MITRTHYKSKLFKNLFFKRGFIQQKLFYSSVPLYDFHKSQEENTTYQPFRLSENFLAKYRNEKPKFGFNGLGELVYRRTYSRVKEDGSQEQWHETIERVVN